MDGDKEYPTICGTGAEDYFCGSYNFENPKISPIQEFTTPYAWNASSYRPDGLYRAVTAFGLYRWHILDPIRFDKDLKVTIQDLAGAMMGVITIKNLIFHQLLFGIRLSHMLSFQPCQAKMI